MRGRRPDGQARFTTEAKAEIRAVRKLLAAQGYKVDVARDGPAYVHEGGGTGSPFYAERSLGDGFAAHVLLLSGVNRRNKSINLLRGVHVSLWYSREITHWELESWSGAIEAAEFVELTQPKVRLKAERMKDRLCPKCHWLRQKDDDVFYRFACMLRRHGDSRRWTCRASCGFKWTGIVPPFRSISEGRIRLVHETTCRKCGQSLVLPNGSQMMHCSRFPDCRYKLDGAKAMAHQLMASPAVEEDEP